MRVALVGLGDIARKGYLPVLAARADIELVLVTRNKTRLDALGDAYRVPRRHTSVADAIAAGLDAAFVSAATVAHHELVSQLLDAGVPVSVDKPLDLHLDRAEDLVRRASERGVSLAVAFNRRWAPAYRALADWDDRPIVLLTKNRRLLPDQPRKVVFDDFIHVVDTLRFLGVADPEDVDVTARRDDAGRLEHVALSLRRGSSLAVGIMNRVAGTTQEVLEVMGRGRGARVVDLATTVRYEGDELIQRRDEWRSVADQRGFTAMVDAFLGAVRAGRVLSAADALATHALCEQVVAAVERVAPGAATEA
ncbi:MAG TPA: Gfo/Idh/MocA family oxidoreductase [Egibacteraceae bacterium]